MLENYIPISYLNDFIFCPRSIYNHLLYQNRDEMHYQGEKQTAGRVAHQKIDNKEYSDKKSILQNFEVVSVKYQLYGKIDLFDLKNKKLIERKNSVTKIYDGYIFQLYAQYFGLIEMGYEVEQLVIYDYSKNKSHPISLPENDWQILEKFENTIENLKSFSLLDKEFYPNKAKCEKCIYHLLCDYSLC